MFYFYIVKLLNIDRNLSRVSPWKCYNRYSLLFMFSTYAIAVSHKKEIARVALATTASAWTYFTILLD